MAASIDTKQYSLATRKTGGRIGALLISFCLCLYLAACDIPASISGSTAQAVGVLDQLINSLNANSAEWDFLVEKAISQLSSSEVMLITQLKDVVNSAETGIGKVVQCSTAYVGQSVLYEIESIRANLLKEAPPVPSPTICNTSPVEVDPTNLVTNPQTVVYWGFNFNPPLKEILVAADGTTTDVSSKLTRDSAYSYHIDLGGVNGVPVTTNDSRLDLSTTSGTYSVTFNPPGLPACVATVRPMNPPPGTITIPASHVSGDADWGGHGPAVTITTQTFVRSQAIDIAVTFDAQEVGGDTKDHTANALYTAYTAPSGYSIQAFSAAKLSDSISYTHTGSSSLESPILRGNDSIVNFYQVNIGEGSLAANNTSLTIAFNALNVALFGPPLGSQACSNPAKPSASPSAPPPTRPTPVPPPGSAPCPFLRPVTPPPGGGC